MFRKLLSDLLCKDRTTHSLHDNLYIPRPENNMETKDTEINQEDKDQNLESSHETMGQYLQRARVEQNKSLDSIAETTCIHIATLQALEDDNYEKLPAAVFVRGFIKIYANHLNIDPNKALSLYKPVTEPPPEDFSKIKKVRKQPPPEESKVDASPFAVGRQILSIALIILLVIFSYKIFFSNTHPEPSTDDSQTIAESMSDGAISEDNNTSADIAAPQDQTQETADKKDNVPTKPSVDDAKPTKPQKKLVIEPVREKIKRITEKRTQNDGPKPESNNAALSTTSSTSQPSPQRSIEEEPTTATPASQPEIAPQEQTVDEAETPAVEQEEDPNKTDRNGFLKFFNRSKPAQEEVSEEASEPTSTDADATSPQSQEQQLDSPAESNEDQQTIQDKAEEEPASIYTSDAPPEEPIIETAPTDPIETSPDTSSTNTDSASAGVTVAKEKPQPDTKKNAIRYYLRANFSELTVLEISVDGGNMREYTFRAGEQWEWQAKQKIELNVNNAGAVILTLNNRTLPSLGEVGEPAQITIPKNPR